MNIRTQEIPAPVRPTNPNDIARALTGRPHVTYSELRTFQACPLKWKFRYVDRAEPEQVAGAMILGSGVHAAIELHLEALMASAPLPSLDQMMDVYRQVWEREVATTPVQYPKGQDANSLEATARRMVEEFVKSPHARPAGELIGVEEKFRVGLGPGLPNLAGRVDLITHEGGELVITDYKTARSMWTQAMATSASDQLLLYAEGCRSMAEDLEANLRLQFIILTKGKTPRIEAMAVELQPQQIDRARVVIGQVFAAMQSENIYPVPTPFNCSGCSFQKRCAAWHQNPGS